MSFFFFSLSELCLDLVIQNDRRKTRLVSQANMVKYGVVLSKLTSQAITINFCVISTISFL